MIRLQADNTAWVTIALPNNRVLPSAAWSLAPSLGGGLFLVFEDAAATQQHVELAQLRGDLAAPGKGLWRRGAGQPKRGVSQNGDEPFSRCVEPKRSRVDALTGP